MVMATAMSLNIDVVGNRSGLGLGLGLGLSLGLSGRKFDSIKSVLAAANTSLAAMLECLRCGFKQAQCLDQPPTPRVHS